MKTRLSPEVQWNRTVDFCYSLMALERRDSHNYLAGLDEKERRLGEIDSAFGVGQIVTPHRLFSVGDGVLIYWHNGGGERQPVYGVSSKGYPVRHHFVKYSTCWFGELGRARHAGRARTFDIIDRGPLRIVRLPDELTGRQLADPTVRRLVLGALRAGFVATRVGASSPHWSSLKRHESMMQTQKNNVYSREELEAMVAGMRRASAEFYRMAVVIGHHAWIEWTGILNEHIKLCQEALDQGIDFTTTSIHAGQPLPMKPHHAEYLAEKMECLFGAALQADDALAKIFVDRVTGGSWVRQGLQAPRTWRGTYREDPRPVVRNIKNKSTHDVIVTRADLLDEQSLVVRPGQGAMVSGRCEIVARAPDGSDEIVIMEYSNGDLVVR